MKTKTTPKLRRLEADRDKLKAEIADLEREQQSAFVKAKLEERRGRLKLTMDLIDREERLIAMDGPKQSDPLFAPDDIRPARLTKPAWVAAWEQSQAAEAS